MPLARITTRPDTATLPPPLAIAERSFRPEPDVDLARFKQINHFEQLLRQAVRQGGLVVPEAPAILVLGAGSGENAVAPCLRMFRGARIVAADPDPRQLAALTAHLEQSGALDRVSPAEQPADALILPDESADLVVGSFVLHRLVDPDLAIGNAWRMLRPGGHAIFLEPFDGYGLLRIAFERILAEAGLRAEPLAPAASSALAAMASDIAGRTMPDPARPGFDRMDQKWLFSRESLGAGARKAGFVRPRFFSHHDHPTLYRDMTRLILREQAGDRASLPAWAWDILDAFDAALPPPVKRTLMLEGAMVLTKPQRGG